MPGLGLAQTTNSSGDWETDGNWDTGAAPSENIDNQIITIGVGPIVRNGSVRFNTNSNGDLIVNDYLTISGDLTWSANSGNADLVINDTLVISGNLVLETNAGSNITMDIAATGALIVQGDFTVANSALNGVDVDGGGLLVVGGDFDTGSGSNISNDGNIYSGSTSGTGNVTGAGGAVGTLTDLVADFPSIDLGALLPVDLVFFRGKTEKGQTILEWATAQELNNDFFTIEQSLDGVVFEVLDQMTGHGTKETMTHYRYEIDGIANSLFYRLKQTDFDGRFEYLGTIYISNQETRTDFYNVYPTMVSKGESLMFSSQAGKWTLFDIKGNLISTGTNSRSIVSPRRSGLYLIRLENAVFSETRRFMVR